MNWTQAEAIALCRIVEGIAPRFGAHVGLTGGLLYKDGPRKDCDLILYRIRQAKEINFEKLQVELQKVGFGEFTGFGFCRKSTFFGKGVDFLCPEEDGEYNPEDAKQRVSKSDSATARHPALDLLSDSPD